MRTEIKEELLSDLIQRGDAELQTGPFGTMLHASSYLASGTPVIAVQHVGTGYLKDEQMPMIGPEDAERLSRYRVKMHDIIFCRKGSVDKRALIRASEEGIIQGSDCIRLRLKSEVLDPKFASYVLGSPFHQEWLRSHANGATMPSLNQSILGLLPLPMLPLPEQRRIAQILGALDDKIELNRRMNSTLEEMARALFRSWFVDFDPVKVKARGGDPVAELGLAPEIAALFPDSFQDSPLGPIPAGWRAGTLLEQANLLSGGTPKTDRSDYWGGDIKWASAKDVSQCADRCLVSTERTITSLGLEQSSTKIIPAFATVVIARGATTGRMVWLAENIAMNQTCYALHSQIGTPFALYCQCVEIMPSLVSTAHGSIFDTITTTTFQNGLCPLAPPYLLIKFEEAVSPMFRLIGENVRECMSLAETRDYLLPRLLSGSVLLGDA